MAGDVAEMRLVAELCRALTTATDLSGFLNSVVSALASRLDAAVVQIWVPSDDGLALELRAAAGQHSVCGKRLSAVAPESFGIGRVARDWRSYSTNAVADDPYLCLQAGESADGLVAFAGHPLLVEDRLLGVLAMYFTREIADDFVLNSAWCAELIAIGMERKLSNASPHRPEAQLRQSQRLETLGRLVAGVAHDFNNLVTVLRGYGEMVLSGAGATGQLRKDTEEIQKAAQRAASLTRQLLGFARRQPIQRRVLDLNLIVADLTKMLRRLLCENIELVTALDPDAVSVRADAAQIEQVVMNLVLNARDAMPHGGRLLIETSNRSVAEGDAKLGSAMPAGRYATLAVTDTGQGIDPRDLPHIFEPFFSTKAPGRGTGLGLATVQQTVRQNGGTTCVASQPGRGTTFTIILPRAEETAPSIYLLAQRSNSRPGTETILLAEDDEQLRAYVRDALRNAGYTVLDAPDGADAARLLDEHAGPIDLVLADMVMPRLSGVELAERSRSAAATTRVLLMSGHLDSGAAGDQHLPAGVAFLQKPFSTQELLSCVRAVLDRTYGLPEPLTELDSVIEAA